MASIKNILNSTPRIDWLVIKNPMINSGDYNQIKTEFCNGWGVSVIAEANSYEIEVNYLAEDFRRYYAYKERQSIIEMVKGVESYER